MGKVQEFLTLMGGLRFTITSPNEEGISFDVEVHDKLEQVGHGQHVRFMINKEKQAGRLRKKAARAIDQ